ncbi:MAG: FKBP-type peptidyl-prolyl cis-trans isomerase [Planctomycetota bacterium]|jgi:FKBP-type peptidyl-prolyl cis-trans isomerase
MAREKRNKKGKGSAGFNRKVSEDFLAKTRNKPDVTETSSGLLFMVVDETEGSKPGAQDTVVVHQRISLVDGTMIDDTYKKDNPVKFPMDEAIEGYREGLLMMCTGSRYRFFIPPDLAWGKRGAGTKIGPEAVLIIDARLIDIK